VHLPSLTSGGVTCQMELVVLMTVMKTGTRSFDSRNLEEVLEFQLHEADLTSILQIGQ